MSFCLNQSLQNLFQYILLFHLDRQILLFLDCLSQLSACNYVFFVYGQSLSGLTSLRELGLTNNSITDISSLGGLTSLTSLRLSGNPGLSDIQPLLDNASLEEVSLLGTKVSCADVALLKRNGVFVFSACH